MKSEQELFDTKACKQPLCPRKAWEANLKETAGVSTMFIPDWPEEDKQWSAWIGGEVVTPEEWNHLENLGEYAEGETEAGAIDALVSLSGLQSFDAYRAERGLV